MLILGGFLIGVFFISLMYHETAINQRHFEIPPSHWDTETSNCEHGFKLVGSSCMKIDLSVDEKRFYHDLRNIEAALKQ